MIFTIPGKPEGKGRPRFTQTGHAYTPQKTRDYEKLVAECFQSAGGKMADGYIELKVTAKMPVPKTAPKKKRAEMLGGKILPAVKPDFDNVLKIVADGLNGVAYKDDAMICKASIEKVYAEEGETVVEVIAVEV